MNGKTLASIIGAMLLAAVIGWRLAFSEAGKTKPPFGASAPPAAATGSTASLSSPPANGPQPAPAVWAAPTGDPLQRYHAAKTTEEKMQVISDFITLGHDHNVFMLQEAVRDASPKVRMLALESAASMLTPELASEVYRFSGRSDDPDIRAMTWSFLAPHPMENRVAVYGDVIVAGQDTALEEALAEMGRTPEMPLFETMLGRSLTKDMPSPRVDRLLKELNDWLKPGGGEVPEFKSVPQLQAWWQANRQRYDQFMLRVDQ